MLTISQIQKDRQSFGMLNNITESNLFKHLKLKIFKTTSGTTPRRITSICVYLMFPRGISWPLNKKTFRIIFVSVFFSIVTLLLFLHPPLFSSSPLYILYSYFVFFINLFEPSPIWTTLKYKRITIIDKSLHYLSNLSLLLYNSIELLSPIK